MLRSKLMIGVALLALLGAIAGCGSGLEPPPEEANTLERTVEETMVVSEQLAEEANVDLEQPTGETDTLSIKGYVTVDAYHYDAATGTYVLFYHDEGSNDVTNIGLDWIEDQLGGAASTTTAIYIALSTDVGTPGAGWTIIPGEITTGGLARATGTYGSTGVGIWEVEATFSALATHTAVQLTGLHWSATGASDSNLLAANTFTAVTLNDGDTLTVTWQLSVS